MTVLYILLADTILEGTWVSRLLPFVSVHRCQVRRGWYRKVPNMALMSSHAMWPKSLSMRILKSRRPVARLPWRWRQGIAWWKLTSEIHNLL